LHRGLIFKRTRVVSINGCLGLGPFGGLPMLMASWDPEEQRLYWSLIDESVPKESVELVDQLLSPEPQARSALIRSPQPRAPWGFEMSCGDPSLERTRSRAAAMIARQG
jgi:hypothetical protein